jgi:hypothetical protein
MPMPNVPEITLEGTATEEQKDAVIQCHALTTDGFAGNISAKLRPVRLDIESNGGKKDGVLVSEITVDKGVFCP